MKVLLDTCTFLWAVDDPDRLPPAVRDLLCDPGNAVFLSVISAWEISIKYGLGSLTLARPPQQVVPHARTVHGFESLPMSEDAALTIHRLPSHHRDPFDRALVAQALAAGMCIATPDPQIARYPVPVRW